MIWQIVVFSFLVGFVGQWLFSVIFIFYFSLAAATGIAALDLYFTRGLGSAGVAWLATIFAAQLGFVASVAVSVGLRMLSPSRREPARPAEPEKATIAGNVASKRDASPRN